MKIRFLFLIVPFLISVGVKAQNQIIPLTNAHAHNDYEHDLPLGDALSHGFTSVEADVYLIDGELYVYHDKPEIPDPERTLKKLYLEPLQQRVASGNGSVYANYNGFFYLMIDFKTEGKQTYEVLKAQLKPYEEMLSKVVKGKREMDKPVLIFISGSRPVRQIMKRRAQLVSLDGRPADLRKGIPMEKMPVISQNYWSISNWNGEGTIDEGNRSKLIQVIQLAHSEGKKVRFWAIPDEPNTWKTLIELGVDFINTDKLSEFRQFILQY
ncbi:phosphatidylinositol-specific phospholipase C/glycerophosphodiester phosphodiesterase family protein [Roseivirga sp.]|uniref:phosphatidylinositol-specific phospholipase C/glycerophosphodiester phosphodiesterase family protein n=1 Tax=Roseivirga sp. TaxID=1964215 RepID=UPI003B5193C6